MRVPALICQAKGLRWKRARMMGEALARNSVGAVPVTRRDTGSPSVHSVRAAQNSTPSCWTLKNTCMAVVIGPVVLAHVRLWWNPPSPRGQSAMRVNLFA